MTVKTIVIPFVSLLATGAIAGTGVGVYFSIENAMNVCRLNFVGTNCLMKDDTNNVVETKDFKKGETAHFRLEGKDYSYMIPMKDDVKLTYTMNNRSFDGDYSYDSSTGNISIVMLDNITISASSFLQRYDLTFIGIDSSMKDDNGNNVYTRNVPAGTHNFFHLLSNDPLHPIPAKNDIKAVYSMTGNPFDEYNYNEKTGAIDFIMKGDITITVMSSIHYELTFDGDNCILNDENEEKIVDKKEIRAGSITHCKLIPDVHHHLPKKEEVKITYTKSGDLISEEYIYDETTGDIRISMVNNITISTTCDLNNYTFTFNGVDCKAYDYPDPNEITTRKYMAKTSVDIQLKGKDDSYQIPPSDCINLFNVDTLEPITDYTYNPATGDMSFDMLGNIALNASTNRIQKQLTLKGTDCYFKDGNGNPVPEISSCVIGGRYCFSIVPTCGPDETPDMFIVSDFKVYTDDGEPFDGYYIFDEDSKEFTVFMHENLIVEVTVIKKWYLNKTFLNNLTKDDVGLIKTVEVNGLDHKVRLVGVDEDRNEKGEINHTSWDFVNTICDSDGFALATRWVIPDSSIEFNDMDYRNSGVRKALNSANDDVKWAQKYGSTWSKDYKKSVINMMPKDLAEAIKPTYKTVMYPSNEEIHHRGDPGWIQRVWKPIGCEDKLFLLSPNEVGASNGGNQEKSTRYTFYMDRKTSKRKKGQINAKPGSAIMWFDGWIYSYAGVNNGGGGCYCTRILQCNIHGASISPYYSGTDGSMSNGPLSNCAYQIAPGFCL